MGKKAKTSRKGKKAWRANISTEDIHDFFDKSTKDALSGGSLTAVPSESIFFVDKSSDLSVKRKIEKHREKVLRVDSILEKNPFVKAVPSSILKDSKKKRKEVTKQAKSSKDGPKDEAARASGVVDLWSDEGKDNRKSKLMKNQSIIPAVEVEPSGCSFNPSFESHQDSLARAVAEEMQKIYRNELGPKPVPLTVHGEAVDEDEKYFLEVDDGIDDDTNVDENGDPDPDKRPSKKRMVTRVEFNRRVRRKERLKKEGEAKKVERLSKEIDSIPDIIQEIAKEDEEKHNRHLRRVVAKEERLKSCPPRLGKHKYEPAPQQVLLSEEITGSLRKLKACCTLAKDRYKSLEKRGLIVPTGKKSRRK